MSYKVGDEIHIEDDDAMAASPSGRLRWILGFSLLAAIIILSIIWMTGAFIGPDTAESTAATEDVGTPPAEMENITINDETVDTSAAETPEPQPMDMGDQ